MSSFRFRPALLKAAIVALSFVVSSTLMLALGAAFDRASRLPVRRDTALARATAERCRAAGARAVQQRCMQDAVLQARARDAAAELQRFAADEASAAARKGRGS